jgi:hypothetical protein
MDPGPVVQTMVRRGRVCRDRVTANQATDRVLKLLQAVPTEQAAADPQPAARIDPDKGGLIAIGPQS